jgi:hypothetical protein
MFGGMMPGAMFGAPKFKNMKFDASKKGGLKGSF